MQKFLHRIVLIRIALMNLIELLRLILLFLLLVDFRRGKAFGDFT